MATSETSNKTNLINVNKHPIENIRVETENAIITQKKNKILLEHKPQQKLYNLSKRLTIKINILQINKITPYAT